MVDTGDFHLYNAVLKAGRYRNDFKPGRLVWRDKEADLAVIKFETSSDTFFKPADSPVAQGASVFSGAAIGIYSVPASRTINLREATGNGPFQTSGEVTGIRCYETDTGIARWACESTLVGRKGMSGGPVVDSEGRLVGVVSEIRPTVFSGIKTMFTMLDSQALEALVAEDRRLHDPRRIGYSVGEKEARQIIQRSLKETLKSTYLIFEAESASSWSAHAMDKKKLAAEQITIRLIPVSTDTVDGQVTAGYNFEIQSIGPVTKSDFSPRLHRTIVTEMEKFGTPITKKQSS